MARKPSILFVDDEDNVRLTLSAVLNSSGFHVKSAATVKEGLSLINQEKFDVLIADLNIAGPADGFTLVSAMRTTQPHAVTLILTGYPAIETALQAIQQQVDDYIIKPANIQELLEKIKAKLASRKPVRHVATERLPAVILQNRGSIIQNWLRTIKKDRELSVISLSDSELVDAVPQVLDIAMGLARGTEISSEEMKVAARHGRTRLRQNYTVPLLIREARLLEKCIAECIETNLLSITISHLISDLTRIFEAIDILLEESAREFLGQKGTGNPAPPQNKQTPKFGSITMQEAKPAVPKARASKRTKNSGREV
jgi:DNA-binding response OmpR family regulator